MNIIFMIYIASQCFQKMKISLMRCLIQCHFDKKLLKYNLAI